MRLFIAVPLPAAVKDPIARLKTVIPRATWTRPDTYHLTLRFLGDAVDEARLPALTSALSAIEAQAFTVEIAGVGRFPPSEKQAARVLWVGLAANAALNTLAAAVESAVVGVGFPPADHPFNPHITLARLKTDKRDPAVSAFLRDQAEFRAPPFISDAFHLIHSTLTPQGPRYATLLTCPLR